MKSVREALHWWGIFSNLRFPATWLVFLWKAPIPKRMICSFTNNVQLTGGLSAKKTHQKVHMPILIYAVLSRGNFLSQISALFRVPFTGPKECVGVHKMTNMRYGLWLCPFWWSIFFFWCGQMQMPGCLIWWWQWLHFDSWWCQNC